MHHRFQLGIALSMIVAFVGPAPAATRFVAPGGTDTANTCLVMASPCATIQHANDSALAGDTISVAAGTYLENVILTVSVTVMGAGAGTTIVEPALSNPNCNAGGAGSLCSGGGAASNIFLVQANDVTIQDLTCDGDNPALTSGIVFGCADLDARNAIITNHIAGTFNNLVVHDVTVKNIYLRGIYASSGGTFNFHDDTIDNVQADPASIGMFNFGGSGMMVHNSVSHANDAISANHSSGTMFSDNTVTASGSGVHTDNAGDGGGSADSVQNNHVSACVTDGYGVWVFVPYIAPTFSGNMVSGCAVGMAAFGGGAPVTTSFTGNQVDGSGGVASVGPTVGVFATTDQLGFGTGDSSTQFTSNLVQHFGEGFHLEQPGNSLTLSASGNTVTDESDAGVEVVGGTGTFTCNRIASNGTGIRSATAATVAHMNAIVGNTTSGADGTGIPPGPPMNAENNWWGCAAGPPGAGCDAVTGNVDTSPAAGVPDACALTPTATVRGKTFLVRDPSAGADPTQRKVLVRARELASDDALVGNPVTNGASLRIIANGATPSSQTFSLPAGPQWSTIGTFGFRYRDAGGTNGPVKLVQILKTPGGVFLAKVLILGRNGSLTVAPPNPGTDGGMVFTINTGASYCVKFGSTAGGTISAGNATLFRARNPTGEGCP